MNRLCIALLLAWAASLASAAERAIEKEILVPASLAQTWASWTTREGIVAFFAPEAVIDARPDGAFHIHIDPEAAPGLRGADSMRYLAVQPMRMLSFDWNAPPSLPEVRAQRTVVILRFEAVDERTTRLRLTHLGWGDGGQWDPAYAYFDRAWGRVLANLQQRWQTGQPIDWTTWLAQLRAMREKAAAAPK